MYLMQHLQSNLHIKLLDRLYVVESTYKLPPEYRRVQFNVSENKSTQYLLPLHYNLEPNIPSQDLLSNSGYFTDHMYIWKHAFLNTLIIIGK